MAQPPRASAFKATLTVTNYWAIYGHVPRGPMPVRIRAVIVARLLTAASILFAIPAQAASATVYIYKVYFDSPGSDRGSNSSLNAEYVVIRNGDNVSHSVSGWTVRDAAGHVYKFGSLSLAPGRLDY